MEDRELANLVVSLGVGEPWGDNFPDRYRLGITDMHSVDAYAFVRDWRVAGALMERVQADGIEIVMLRNGVQVAHPKWSGYEFSGNESLPRAITEACCAALGEDG